MYLALEDRKKVEKYEPQKVTKVKFYELLGRQGPGYWYQLRIFILFGLQWLIAAQILLGYRFTFQNVSFDCNNNLSKEACKEFVCNLNRDDQINYLKYKYQGGKRITASSEFKFYCEDEYKINVISSVSAFSCLIGFILFPHLSNLKGPKFIIVLGWTIASIGCIINCLAQSYAILLVGCSLQFLAIRPIMTLHLTFINDNSQCKFREFSTIGVQLFFGLGQFISILIQHLILDWRVVVFYFQFIPILLTSVVSYFYLFESPIFIHKYSTVQAIQILNQIAKLNKNEQIKINILQSRLLDQNKKSPSFIDILTPERQRTRIIATSIIFFVIQVASYSASYYMNKEKLNIYQNNLILVTSEFIAICIINVFIPSIKRKQMIFFGLVSGAIITFSFIFIPIPSWCKHEICAIKIIQILLLSFLSFSFSISWSIFYVYIPELFSININSLVLAINGMCGVIGSFLVPYLVLLFEGNFNYMFLLGILLLIASIHLIFVDETQGKQIPLDNSLLKESNQQINQEEEEIIALES